MAGKQSPPFAVRARLAPGSARLGGAIAEQQRRLATSAARLDKASSQDVHDSRVAARRLRSILKTYRPMLDVRRTRLYRADLRSFAGTLGAVREADVRHELLTELSVDDRRISPAAHRRLGVLLEDARKAARANLRRSLAEPGWAALCAALARQRATRGLLIVRDADMDELLSLAARAWRRAVRQLRRGPASADELHELRLAFKHCRYALEPVADSAPKAAARLLRRLRAAQACLGDHRDTLLADRWVRANERVLGAALVMHLAEDLADRELALRRQASQRAAKVLDAWGEWRAAARPVTRGARSGRA